MVDLLEQLQEAADRGVEVTIVANDYPAPALRFKWRHEEYRDCAISRFNAAGLSLYVIDCDGDFSEWSLSEGKTILAKGSIYDCDPYYHFDACLMAAEAALIAEVSKRRAALIKRRGDNA